MNLNHTLTALEHTIDILAERAPNRTITARRIIRKEMMIIEKEIRDELLR